MAASPPPTILFMGRIFEVPWGGVREMADSLLKAAAPLAAEQGRRIEVLVPRAGMTPIEHPAITEVVLPRFGGNRILWDHWTVSNYANAQPNVVLYNIKLVLPERLRIPGFTTLHDLMYFPQPAKYNWREYLLLDSLYMRLMVPRTVKRAPLTHCVSEYTARDAAELFPSVKPSRFRTILHGVDVDRFAPREWVGDDYREWEALRTKGLREPYVLYTGGLSRRKNVRVLAAAFGRFLKSHPEYTLVVTGGAKPTIGDPALARAFNMLPDGKLVRLGAVSSRAMELLYQGAAMYVFPSLYEGFGMPPLEAQAAGCPVICSNATSLPEVVEESALLFNPRSPAELVQCMELLTNQAARQRVINEGTRNVKRFDWTETARQWLALADEVAVRGRRRG